VAAALLSIRAGEPCPAAAKAGSKCIGPANSSLSGMTRCADPALAAAADGRTLTFTKVLPPGRGAAANGFCGSVAADLEAWPGRTAAGLIAAGFAGWVEAALGGGAERPRGRAKLASLASTIAQPNIRDIAILDTRASLGRGRQ
jgi:hypothetical protein